MTCLHDMEGRDRMMSQTNAHILMVDDEEEIRHVVKVLLESEGFTVTEAASGEEALALFTPVYIVEETKNLDPSDVPLEGKRP